MPSDIGKMTFSWSRPPPTSTLFPYTTLFRSVEGAALGEPDVLHRRAAPQRQGLPRAAGGDQALEPDGVHRVRRDRKSTRLNSSHMSSSYAVFCLKKKNHQLRLRYLVRRARLP